MRSVTREALILLIEREGGAASLGDVGDDGEANAAARA